MNIVRQILFRLGEACSDLADAAFAALAWVEEGDTLQTFRGGRPVHPPLGASANPFDETTSTHWAG